MTSSIRTKKPNNNLHSSSESYYHPERTTTTAATKTHVDNKNRTRIPSLLITDNNNSVSKRNGLRIRDRHQLNVGSTLSSQLRQLAANHDDKILTKPLPTPAGRSSQVNTAKNSNSKPPSTLLRKALCPSLPAAGRNCGRKPRISNYNNNSNNNKSITIDCNNISSSSSLSTLDNSLRNRKRPYHQHQPNRSRRRHLAASGSFLSTSSSTRSSNSSTIENTDFGGNPTVSSLFDPQAVMESYSTIRRLGQGTCANVYLVRDVKTAKTFALKQIQLDERSKTHNQRAILKEVSVLQQLRHPHVVQCRKWFIDLPGNHLCIVLDYCNAGSLEGQISDAAKNKRFIPESKIMNWFVQISMGVAYIHSRHILHRDLKPQNVLLNKQGFVKIGDFGIAKELKETLDTAKTVVGTPCYLSPELCQDAPYNWKSDIWALGCLLYELCALRPAFNAENILSLFYKIVKGEFDPIPQLIQGILAVYPGNRPSASAILADPFVQRHLDVFIDEKETLRNLLAQRKVSNARTPNIFRHRNSYPVHTPTVQTPNINQQQIHPLSPFALQQQSSLLYRSGSKSPATANHQSFDQSQSAKNSTKLTGSNGSINFLASTTNNLPETPKRTPRTKRKAHKMQSGQKSTTSAHHFSSSCSSSAMFSGGCDSPMVSAAFSHNRNSTNRRPPSSPPGLKNMSQSCNSATLRDAISNSGPSTGRRPAVTGSSDDHKQQQGRLGARSASPELESRFPPSNTADLTSSDASLHPSQSNVTYCCPPSPFLVRRQMVPATTGPNNQPQILLQQNVNNNNNNGNRRLLLEQPFADSSGAEDVDEDVPEELPSVPVSDDSDEAEMIELGGLDDDDDDYCDNNEEMSCVRRDDRPRPDPRPNKHHPLLPPPINNHQKGSFLDLHSSSDESEKIEMERVIKGARDTKILFDRKASSFIGNRWVTGRFGRLNKTMDDTQLAYYQNSKPMRNSPDSTSVCTTRDRKLSLSSMDCSEAATEDEDGRFSTMDVSQKFKTLSV